MHLRYYLCSRFPLLFTHYWQRRDSEEYHEDDLSMSVTIERGGHGRVICDLKRLKSDLEAGSGFCNGYSGYMEREISLSNYRRILERHCARWGQTSSEIAFKMVSGWLNECLHEHTRCASDPDQRAPKRLLNVAKDPGGLVRLILGEQIRRASYATLSYRWGNSQELMLKQDNIEGFKRGIPSLSLPRTFRDAVFVCQGLKIDYLWS